MPWLSFWPFTPFLRSRGVPPFGPGLRPWPGLLGRLRDEALRPIVTGALEDAMLGPVNAVRETAGAKAVRSADELLRRAPLMLVATGEPFEYPHPDWGDPVELIGPCDFDPPAAAPQWLTDIDRPIVLVTTSSDRQADSQLPIAAMAALADAPVHVVATFPSGVPDGVVVPSNATVTHLCHTEWCWTGLSALSLTAEWAPLRKRFPAAFPSASCRTAVTSSRSPAC